MVNPIIWTTIHDIAKKNGYHSLANKFWGYTCKGIHTCGCGDGIINIDPLSNTAICPECASEIKWPDWRLCPECGYELKCKCGGFKQEMVIPKPILDELHEIITSPPSWIFNRQTSLGDYNNHIIYFIQAGETIKIGITRNLETRLKSLQVGNAHELIVLKTIDGTKQTEELIHHHFRDYNMNGEWFSGKIKSMIERGEIGV